MANNKVKYNVRKCYFAPVTFADDGTPTYETPIAMPGAVSLSLEANGEPENFYADGIAYFVINNNMGYDGDLELALIPEEFRIKALNEKLDDYGVLVENAERQLNHFALMFEFEGDQKAIRHVLYNCTASRPSMEGETTEDTKEPKPEKITIKATPLTSGIVKAKTGNTTATSQYNSWYTAVYMPTESFNVTPATLTIAPSASGTVTIDNAAGTVTAAVAKGGTTSTDLTVTVGTGTATIAASADATGAYNVTFSDAGTSPASTDTVTVTVSGS